MRYFQLIFIILLISTFSPLSYIIADTTGPADQDSNIRDVSLKINVIFIGFEDGIIDNTYQTWNNPSYKYQSILIPGLSTNVRFTFDYNYIQTERSIDDKLINYLNSIQKVETTQNIFSNLTYFKVDDLYSFNYTSMKVKTINTLYDADKVEKWLYEHQDEMGVHNDNEYKLIIANLSKTVPSITPLQYSSILAGEEIDVTPHYYNLSFSDIDLNSSTNGHWMTSWGGKHRLYFIDISAGPSPLIGQLPLQISKEVHKIDIETEYGSKWINQFLSDYVFGAVYNLFAPDLIYPLYFSEKYVINIIIFDNRTDGVYPEIRDTVKKEIIKSELSRLVPLSQVEVQIQFKRLESSPDLQNIIVESTNEIKKKSNLTKDHFYPPNMVDMRPVYEWLSQSGKNNVVKFFDTRTDKTEYHIPVFAFVFTDDIHFAFTHKEFVADQIENDFWGVALYDMVLISLSEDDLTSERNSDDYSKDTGFGFTHTIIHEVGHMLGLNHPFIYDPTEDFVDSVMAYYPLEYAFSQFDKDTLNRGFADHFIMDAEKKIKRYSSNILNYTQIHEAKNKLNDAILLYDNLEYELAAKSAIEASSKASSLSGVDLPIPAFLTTSVLTIFFATSLGFIIGYFIRSKRKKHAV